MFALKFCFPVGRYHATPWGRHPNEAAVAWPPEPYRIIRTLIGVYHQKADRNRFPKNQLEDLVGQLALTLPFYKLPQTVTHAHIRSYMPAPPKGKSIVFDGFTRFDPEEPIVVYWPELTLESQLFALAKHLAENLNYLGRSESWVDATACESDYNDPDAYPESTVSERERPSTEHLLAPLSSDEYERKRKDLLSTWNNGALLSRKKSSKKTLEKASGAFLKTLPERLLDALSLQTGDLQINKDWKWDFPPASQWAWYKCPNLNGAQILRHTTSRSVQRGSNDVKHPTVVRFLLSGRPLPQLVESLQICQVMRRAVMSRYGWKGARGKDQVPQVPSIFSGRDENSQPLKDPKHSHAFFLVEATPNENTLARKIHRVLIYCSKGFNEEAQSKLFSVRKLYNLYPQRKRANEKSRREELKLALDHFGYVDDFEDSLLLGKSRFWESVTPYFSPWMLRRRFCYREALLKECRNRDLPKLEEVEELEEKQKDCLRFKRSTPYRHQQQADHIGRFFRLTFPEPVEGPLALGFQCHYGMGLFERAEEKSSS